MVGVPGRVVGSIDTVGWLLSGVLDATRPWDQTQTPWSHASKVDPCGLGEAAACTRLTCMNVPQ